MTTHHPALSSILF